MRNIDNPNEAITQKLIVDLEEYLTYLHEEYGYLITLHHIETISNACWMQLLYYNYHVCEVCRCIKNSNKAWQHCIDRQKKIIEKVKSGPFKGTCYAGVSEYIFPIADIHGSVYGFICVSGYTVDRQNSKDRAFSAAQRYGLPKQQLVAAVDELREPLPDFEKLKAQILPVQNMLSTLFYFNSMAAVPNDADASCKRLYYDMLHYINGNFRGCGFSLREVCRHFNISYSYASHLFSKYNPTSFSGYIRSGRVEAAKRYLAHTALPLSYIAAECGFSDSNYFSGIFKAETGISPSEYRRQYRQIRSGMLAQSAPEPPADTKTQSPTQAKEESICSKP